MDNQPNRPSWDEYFKEIVQVTSKRSPCHRLQVGSLLVKDHRIISQGYNGFLPGNREQHVSRRGTGCGHQCVWGPPPLCRDESWYPKTKTLSKYHTTKSRLIRSINE